ncbi:hypothetical protein LOC71_12360 [Rhodopirellula sp. JC740]|uniref:Uncharacterized protein n=1 Tax=Rhodopirellula halodulae TaxID=2894198 RepID=A0ABS8NHR4_9BACT|nr:hypothetical protein [Rhodopirellula sp. JC740]MCC9643071.1 hypothetical protein [Rhodopirellula sp. JC740]
MTLTKPPSKANPSKKSVAGNPSGSVDATGSSPLPDDASWQKLRKKIVARWQRHPATKTFGDDAVDGQVYLWGLSTLLDGAVDPLSERLARLATADPTIQINDADLIPAAELFLDASREGRSDLASDLGCVLWAASLPALTQTLPLELWWGLLSELQRRVAATLAQDETPSPHHLFLAGEVGLTLAFRLADIPSCASRGKASASAVQAYLEDDEVIEEALRSPEALRVIMASIVRCEQLLQGVTKRKFKKSHQASAEELAGWIAAMTRVDGTQVFSRTAAREASLDHVGLVSRSTSKKTTAKGSGRKSKAVKPTAPAGLMGRAMKYDTDSLMPAFSASLGQSHSGGRLAWEISLPESMWHSDEAKIVAMLPEWDVRRGRTYIDYSEEVMSVEIMAGRRTIFRGPLAATVELDGVVQYPSGPWHSTCEYTDDDVHYLEFEQTYTGGVVLQRQFMLIRDDRCVMVADAVLPAQAGTASQWDHSAEDETSPANALASSSPFGELADVAIRCVTHFPVSEKISVIPDEQTRELYFHDSKRRAMMLPLPASEWRVGPTDCTAEPTEVSLNEGGVTADSQLTHGVTVATQGLGAVYSPLWIDFQSRRFHRKRTWRTLTVADELQLIPRNVATGFRIQMGSEQWMVYRSLVGRRPRSVLGKHLVADFFAGRFHASDGGVEELVTVDDAAPE